MTCRIPTSIHWLLALALLSVAAPVTEAGFVVTGLGDLGKPGANISPLGINSSGDIVGTVGTPAVGYSGFIYRAGSMKLLNFGGNTEAYGINSSGQVTGDFIGSDQQNHAFLYSNGVMQDLGPGSGKQINSQGQLVIDGFNGNHAAIYDHGTVKYLPDGSSAVAINDKGQVPFFSGNGRAYLYDGGTTKDLGANGFPSAINNNGQVAGFTLGVSQAFLYSSGSTQLLGSLYGLSTHPVGINNSGEIVGNTANIFGQAVTPFYYSGNGLQDINTLLGPNSNATILTVAGINDFGEIAGTGFVDGKYQLLLLSPQGVNPTPEPSSLVLLGIGAASLAGYRWKRRKQAAA